ncbi:control protein 45 homolog [Seminavis robusta]|uniref:Control protein 45 homolog n=1 Tax=Seminavis robusta TaxID=568900 RepID=A0A9N8HEH1_9STRA|nr:control protein 45 homolog [Seminavis robusta]|eukprot:Sro515_g158220.1 control protein 45 homolog (556) ;mRNA; f:12033-13820
MDLEEDKNPPSTEEPDVDYDGEDERDPQAGSPTKKKKKKKKQTSTDNDLGHDTDSTNPASDASDDDDDDDDDNLQTAATAPTTAPSPTQAQLTPAERFRQRQDRLRLYYSHGSSHGAPTCYVAHKIATQLRFGNVADLLWLCMVGVTDAWLQSRLDIVGYAEMADSLREKCLKLFPLHQDLYERAQTTVYAEELLVGAGGSQQQQTKLTFSEQGRILPQTDHRFFLLRSSSLLDAMQCSNYVSTQMQLWTKPGMQRLHELLARMGYPLEDCHQPFNFMKPSLRRRLVGQLAEYGEEFGLEELEFTSFVRVTGFSTLTSASDTCYAASALLECPTISSSTEVDPSGDWDLQCFHAAYDSLGAGNHNQNGKTIMTTGLQWAMKLQRLILATAVGLVSRNAITRLRHFRYAYVTASSSGNSSSALAYSQSNNNSNNNAPYHVLAKPLALTRLAYYLMDMHRANGKWVGTDSSGRSKALPLILLAEQPATQTFLVLGQQMSEKQGHLTKNKFGQYFELVAQTMKEAVARLESFDSHVVEVDAEHVERFLEQLHYFMDSV